MSVIPFETSVVTAETVSPIFLKPSINSCISSILSDKLTIPVSAIYNSYFFIKALNFAISDNASLSVSDVDINVDMFHQLKHSYTGSLFWRPYIPLGSTNRFALFAEVQLNFTGSESKVVASTSDVDGIPNYRGTYSKSLGVSVGLQPGIVAFITNNAAVELSIGILGIGFDRTLQNKNQVETGKTDLFNTNFKLNLLSIGFGMSFYL